MFLGSKKRDPVELQEKARLHFPYTSSTYYHVESVLQKRLKRQDHPLLIVSISFYNNKLLCKRISPVVCKLELSCRCLSNATVWTMLLAFQKLAYVCSA